MKFKDYYATLGVPPDASLDTIKKAYRKLARRYHPDVSREPLAELRFKEVGEAYAVLKDPEKRQQYDMMPRPFSRRETPRAERRAEPPRENTRPRESREFRESRQNNQSRQAHQAQENTAGNTRRERPENFGNILDEMMGRPDLHPPRQRNVNVHGSDQHAKVQIDLEDTYHGTARSISVPTYTTDDYGMPLVSKRILKVSIPKGVRAGQTLRLAGQGFPGMGEGKAGDLYLEVVIRPHRRYRVEGRDVYVDVPISASAAMLGTTAHVFTPEGSIQLSVPPGTVAGRKLRVRGKGIPGDPSGDLYAVITTIAPPVHTVVAQKAYRALKAAFDFSPRTSGGR